MPHWSRCLVICLGILGLIFSGSCFASSTEESIAFYTHQGAKKASEMLDIHTAIVPIIKQNDWVKVGLQPSGKIGWINISQYKKALQTYYQPQSESFSVTVTRDKNGKANTAIKGYRNGHLLSQKEAQKLYEQMQSQGRDIRISAFDQPFFDYNLITPFRIINSPLSVPIKLNDLPQLEPVQTVEPSL
ncbi:MAG: hypothetical protein CL816_04805 [Coxiellaceae bacterium]|nr:hypothetical protein [Coxiellaceae bacterium]|tara:strand:+ start:41 stop:604 length:564 start_codon:yes stop_codon:yes gene_type:complete